MNAPEKLPTTAAECTSLAIIALDQAEKLVNGNAPDAHLVAAVARIGQGWAATAMAMLEAERSVTVELTEFDPPMQSPPALTPAGEEGWDHQHTSFCRHNWVRPMEPCVNNCGQRPGTDRASDAAVTRFCPATCRITDPPTPDVKLPESLDPVVMVDVPAPDHEHSPDCEHPWNSQSGRCDQCRQFSTDCYPRCPVPCPEPGADT